MKPSEDRLALGCRLIVGKHNATVRFIGNVKGQDGNWVGLEWDDPSRGKHDGSHDGVRYFSCTHHPCGGSLVRLAKLIATADLGQTLESAIQTRYKEAGNTDGNNASEGAYVSTASHRHVPIELVGADVAAAAAGEDGLLCQASVEGMRVASLVSSACIYSFISVVCCRCICSIRIFRCVSFTFPKQPKKINYLLFTTLPTISLCAGTDSSSGSIS